MVAYMNELSTRPDHARRWFADGRVADMLLPSARDQTIPRVRLVPALPGAPLYITQGDRNAIAVARTKARLDALSDLLASTLPELCSQSQRARDQMTQDTVRRMQAHGILQAKALFMICAWELAHGPNFEDRDPVLQSILARACDETQKMHLLRARMAELA